jgi:hypothetical protein
MADYDLFISYCTSHGNRGEALARNLQSQGYKVRLDVWALLPQGLRRVDRVQAG